LLFCAKGTSEGAGNAGALRSAQYYEEEERQRGTGGEKGPDRNAVRGERPVGGGKSKR